MKTKHRHLPVMMLVLLALAQGALALAPVTNDGVCGAMGMQSADAAMSACGHAVPNGHHGGCVQCSHCAGGHCVSWAVPVTAFSPTPVFIGVELTPEIAERPPAAAPAHIYRPPRLLS